MNKAPVWLLEALGKEVVLTRDFDEGRNIYPAGYRVVLISIQAGGGQPYVTVSIDPNDVGWEENLPIDGIAPVRD